MIHTVIDNNILIEGSDKLTKVSKPVADVENLNENELSTIYALHIELQRHLQLNSLSAVQLGSLIRICAVRVNGVIIVMLNPEIILSIGKCRSVEGCCSVRGKYKVHRPYVGCVRFYDINGDKHVLFYKRDIIKLISHEIDHMNGLLISRGKEVKE